MENNRGQWSSNLVFLLAAVGSAIGLGNLWGFPYKMGANGGVYFLIIYLVLAIFCGVVVMCVEMAIGRSTGKSPIQAMGQLGKKWKCVGAFGVISATVIMGFYGMLIGYSLRYFVGFFIQIFGASGFGGLGGGDFFGAYTGNVGAVILFTAITFIICGVFVMLGTSGLEKFNKVGIPALFIILIGIIIYNFTLPGALDGYKFMFTSKGMEIAGTEFHFFKAVRTAGGQMLFSLSLGMGAMITYGSYLSKGENISKNAWIIPALDTLAAIFAGMAIFPAVFAMGQDVAAGPGLLYITMHNVFTTMGFAGNIIGALFYLLVIFAGVSSAISLMEVTTSSIIDGRAAHGKKSNRKVITLVVALIMFVISIPVCLDKLGGSAITQGTFIRVFGDLLDGYDFITEGVLMPLASVLMCIFVGWKMKISWLSNEITQHGQKFYCKGFFTVCIKYITPVLMAFVLVSLALSYFGI